MQTFLPYADFERSAAVLDSPRLGKQRVETLQILRALLLPDYGWANHPAVVMWRHRMPALVHYGLTCAAQWRSRGHADSTEPLITEFAPQVADLDQAALAAQGLLPSWVGDERLHASHRSALLRKDPARYLPLFPDLPDDLPYFWPGADDGPGPAPGTLQDNESTRPLWVVRASDPAVLGRFVADGVVGLDSSSGLDVDLTGETDTTGTTDATGTGTLDLRGLLRQVAPGRRPGKQLRQLQAFLADLGTGDAVAVPVQGETRLLLGTVTGDYQFAADEPVHRRRVRWEGVAARHDVRPRAALQDPRRLFAVRLVRHGETG